jgi:hypothetical protein
MNTGRGLTPLVQCLTFLFRWIFRLDERVTLDIPVCVAHRSEQMLRRWGGALVTVLGLALLPFAFKSIEVRTPLEALTWGGTLVMILGGPLVILLGVNILDLVELNGAFAAYQGFGLEYMQKIPCEIEIFSPKRGADERNSDGDSSRPSGPRADMFSTDL